MNGRTYLLSSFINTKRYHHLAVQAQEWVKKKGKTKGVQAKTWKREDKTKFWFSRTLAEILCLSIKALSSLNCTWHEAVDGENRRCGGSFHVILSKPSTQSDRPEVKEGPRKQKHSPLELCATQETLICRSRSPFTKNHWPALALCQSLVFKTSRNLAISGQITNSEWKGPFHTTGWLMDIQCVKTPLWDTPWSYPIHASWEF